MVYIKIIWYRLLLVLTRIKTYRKMKRVMHSMTLNSVGGLYEVIREHGEKDGHFERRLLRKASKTPPSIPKDNKEAAI